MVFSVLSTTLIYSLRFPMSALNFSILPCGTMFWRFGIFLWLLEESADFAVRSLLDWS